MSALIHQEVDFKASPQRVYEALTDAKQFSGFSGLPAEIHSEAGGTFKCFGGQITGRMTELFPNQKIVQTWHVAMWPDGVNNKDLLRGVCTSARNLYCRFPESR